MCEKLMLIKCFFILIKNGFRVNFACINSEHEVTFKKKCITVEIYYDDYYGNLGVSIANKNVRNNVIEAPYFYKSDQEQLEKQLIESSSFYKSLKVYGRFIKENIKTILELDK